MDLIIGGAYQGKRAYAMEKYRLTEEQLYICTRDAEIDFSARCVDRIEEFVMRCADHAENAEEFFRAHRDEWENSVLICRDIFCGVVPMDAELRLWREMTGRLCAYLAGCAGSVTRIYCGLEQKLK